MNIKEQLIINNYDDSLLRSFYFRNSKDKQILKCLISDFLTCSNDRKRESIAIILMNQCLRPLEKHPISSTLGILNMYELFEQYDLEEKNRKHMVHQINTFLLGLLFYNKCKKIETVINNKLEAEKRKTSAIDLYHSTSDEFFFRWRIAALTHDLGNGISILGKNQPRINKFLLYLDILLDFGIGDQPPDIELISLLSTGKNTVDFLTECYPFINLRGIWNNLLADDDEKIHEKIKNYYDHGIMSTIIVLKYLDNLYRNHSRNWDYEYFNYAIVPAMHAVAIHNLDFYATKDENTKIFTKQAIYNIDQDPFGWLLKVCDLLQEWDKVKAKDESNYQEADEIEYEITRTNIIIKQFTDPKKLKKTLDDYFTPDGVVIFHPALS